MIKWKVYLVLTCITQLALAGFNDYGVGARPLGFGGAFVALADDGNAASYNAAGLGFIEKSQFSVTRMQRFRGLVDHNQVSAVVPAGSLGTIGTSIGILGEKGGIYKEQLMAVSYSKSVFQRFSLGSNLRSFTTNFDRDHESIRENPYFQERQSVSAFSMDIGVMAKPITGLSIGLSIENLLPADIAISSAQQDIVPRNLRIGFGYKLDGITSLIQQESLRGLLASGQGQVELAFRNGNSHLRIGAEIWASASVALRAGYGLKSGVNSVTTMALGTSVKFAMVRLDYVFQILSSDMKNNAVQLYSLNLIF